LQSKEIQFGLLTLLSIPAPFTRLINEAISELWDEDNLIQNNYIINPEAPNQIHYSSPPYTS